MFWNIWVSKVPGYEICKTYRNYLLDELRVSTCLFTFLLSFQLDLSVEPRTRSVEVVISRSICLRDEGALSNGSNELRFDEALYPRVASFSCLFQAKKMDGFASLMEDEMRRSIARGGSAAIGDGGRIDRG